MDPLLKQATADADVLAALVSVVHILPSPQERRSAVEQCRAMALVLLRQLDSIAEQPPVLEG